MKMLKKYIINFLGLLQIVCEQNLTFFAIVLFHFFGDLDLLPIFIWGFLLKITSSLFFGGGEPSLYEVSDVN